MADTNAKPARPERDRWGGVWLHTLGDPDFVKLSRRAVQVYLVLTCYATANSAVGSIHYRDAWPSHARLAELAGVAVGTVKRGISELKAGGWVEVRRTRGSLIYALKRAPPRPVGNPVDNPADFEAA